MRKSMFRGAVIAGAALALSACGGGGDKAADNAMNEADNTALEPLNDQSATESVGNVTEPVAPPSNVSESNAASDPGDDGGETIETNTPGI